MIALLVPEISPGVGFCDEEEEEELGILVVRCHVCIVIFKSVKTCSLSDRSPFFPILEFKNGSRTQAPCREVSSEYSPLFGAEQPQQGFSIH